MTIIIVLFVLNLIFIDRCSLINLSTADLFRSKELLNSKSLIDTVASQNYEIIPLKADFPILYDSIQNEFYLANQQGLTKIDGQGNLLISDALLSEKYTSVFDFANFTPYVFAEKGVYDFSGNKLVYTLFSKVLNANNEISDADFKTLFENSYRDATLVIYGTDRNLDYEKECYPMYFKIKNEWILIFCQKGDTRFSHLLTSKDYNDVIGQIDFENNPAKFADKRLMVLKDVKNGIYSTKQFGKKIDDQYLDTYYSILLKERKLDYKSTNEIKLRSRKKEAYHFTGSFIDLPNWINPTFLNTAFFELNYNNEKLFFKEKAIKYSHESNCKNELFLYELPINFKKQTKVAFLHYALNLGGYENDSTGIFVPEIKNTGLYLIRPKKK